jgi:hypothetical protein
MHYSIGMFLPGFEPQADTISRICHPGQLSLPIVPGCLDVETLEKLKYKPLFTLLDSMGVANPMMSTNSGGKS